MSTKQFKLPFRIAVRDEGTHVHVYLARPDTMVNARLIASVEGVAARLPGVRDKIIELGQAVVTALVQNVTKGVTPDFILEQPPEHEKAGHS